MIIVPRPFPIFRSINYIKGRSTGNDGSQYLVTGISSGNGSHNARCSGYCRVINNIYSQKR